MQLPLTVLPLAKENKSALVGFRLEWQTECHGGRRIDTTTDTVDTDGATARVVCVGSERGESVVVPVGGAVAAHSPSHDGPTAAPQPLVGGSRRRGGHIVRAPCTQPAVPACIEPECDRGVRLE